MINNVIKCPRCSYEYLDSEIFIPKYFFGKPSYVRRDGNGKILHVSGLDPQHFEVYRCDNCNTTFKVNASIEFSTEIDDIHDVYYEHETYIEK